MSNSLLKDLGIKLKGQKYRFIEEDPNINNDFVPVHLEEDAKKVEKKEKIESTNFLNENIESLYNNNNQNGKASKLKKKLKNLNKTKETSIKVQKNYVDIKNEIAAENEKAYSEVVKSISKYSEYVDKNKKADILDFKENQSKHINFSTSKSILNNNKQKNKLEEEINQILIRNKYNSEEAIIEKENETTKLTPDVLERRREEMAKLRHLMFNQEIRNRQKKKIKSKLYHKIKKKQKLKQEAELLKQLQDVDPEAVKEYLNKQMSKRADERISLKHSLNKFNKTIKRYNLIHDENIRESMMENYRQRDKLMEKVQNPYANDDEDREEDEEDEDENDEDEDEKENEDNEDSQYYNNDLDLDEQIDQTKILLDFNENKNNDKKSNKNDKKGVYAMKFMQNSLELEDKLSKIIKNKKDDYKEDEEEVKLESNEDYDDDKSLKQKRLDKILNIKKKSNDDIAKSMKSKINKQIINIKENDNENDKEEKMDDSVKLTSSMILKNSLKQKNEKLNKNNNKINLDENDLKNFAQNNNSKELNSILDDFVISNNDNQKEFLNENYNELLNQNKVDYLQGWGTWTGQSKSTQAKEFLIKKRLKDIQEKKTQEQWDSIKNKNLKISNVVDKKFNNYMVKELPHPYSSISQFEKINSTPFGPEWNSLSSYKQITEPKVVKFIGKVIQPMGIAPADTIKAKKLNEIIEKASKKIIRTKAKL